MKQEPFTEKQFFSKAFFSMLMSGQDPDCSLHFYRPELLPTSVVNDFSQRSDFCRRQWNVSCCGESFQFVSEDPNFFFSFSYECIRRVTKIFFLGLLQCMFISISYLCENSLSLIYVHQDHSIVQVRPPLTRLCTSTTNDVGVVADPPHNILIRASSVPAVSLAGPL